VKDVQGKNDNESTLPFYVMEPERESVCKHIVLKEDTSNRAKKGDKDDKKDKDKNTTLNWFYIMTWG
jgi:hypothetical protein